jgi:hypothetical protein
MTKRRSQVVDPRDEEIERLERRLSRARQTVIDMCPAPDDIKTLLSFETTFDQKTHADYRRWEMAVTDAVIAIAVPDPRLSNQYEERAACPLCKGVGSVPGFKLPLGLDYHLNGAMSAIQCPVTEAAFEDALQGLRERSKEGLK